MNQPEMQLEVLRFSSEQDSTNGLLFDVTGGDRNFLSYTLEDEYRKEKVSSAMEIGLVCPGFLSPLGMRIRDISFMAGGGHLVIRTF